MKTVLLAKRLKVHFPDLLSEPRVFRDEVTLDVLDPQRIVEVCRYAKDELGFRFLVDLTGVDFPEEEPRFMVVYHLYHPEERVHLRLQVRVDGDPPEVPSVTSVWRGANWHEREAWDMLGIRFRGHPNLKRILMWEGYPYHPLRKDFSLAGKPTEMPGVAFTEAAPLEGGPFVARPGRTAREREPRARPVEDQEG